MHYIYVQFTFIQFMLCTWTPGVVAVTHGIQTESVNQYSMLFTKLCHAINKLKIGCFLPDQPCCVFAKGSE